VALVVEAIAEALDASFAEVRGVKLDGVRPWAMVRAGLDISVAGCTREMYQQFALYISGYLILN
jgi:hypothetical protein